MYPTHRGKEIHDKISKISKISDSFRKKSHQNMNSRSFQKIVHSRISISIISKFFWGKFNVFYRKYQNVLEGFWFISIIGFPNFSLSNPDSTNTNVEIIFFEKRDLIMISSFVFDCFNLKWWLERSFHKRTSIYWKGNKLLRVLVFYPPEKFFTPSPTTILIHTPRRYVWLVPTKECWEIEWKWSSRG